MQGMSQFLQSMHKNLCKENYMSLRATSNFELEDVKVYCDLLWLEDKMEMWERKLIHNWGLTLSKDIALLKS